MKYPLFQPGRPGRAQRAIILFGVGAALGLTLPACRQVTRPDPARGVVRYHTDIPADCPTTSGIKQSVVRRVSSEGELRKHYGLTFKVHFNDGVSPTLYGTLYYQNRDRNLYCMALPDGRFASFEDSQVSEHRRNVMQEICFPIQDCPKD